MPNPAVPPDDPVLARSLWLKAAQINDTQLDNVDGAVDAYRKILDADPGDLEVLEALEALYRRTERWADLQTVLRRRSELAETAEDQELLLAQISFIYDEMLEQPNEAISVNKEILEIDPASRRVT